MIRRVENRFGAAETAVIVEAIAADDTGKATIENLGYRVAGIE